jgi:hypothetical protein
MQAYNLESKICDDYEKALEPESSEQVKSGMIAGTVFGFSQMAGGDQNAFISVFLWAVVSSIYFLCYCLWGLIEVNG